MLIGDRCKHDGSNTTAMKLIVTVTIYSHQQNLENELAIVTAMTTTKLAILLPDIIVLKMSCSSRMTLGMFRGLI